MLDAWHKRGPENSARSTAVTPGTSRLPVRAAAPPPPPSPGLGGEGTLEAETPEQGPPLQATAQRYTTPHFLTITSSSSGHLELPLTSTNLQPTQASP